VNAGTIMNNWKDFVLKLGIQLIALLVPAFIFLSSMNREIGELKTKIESLEKTVERLEIKVYSIKISEVSNERKINSRLGYKEQNKIYSSNDDTRKRTEKFQNNSSYRSYNWNNRSGCHSAVGRRDQQRIRKA
jgi:hypothetical protein